MTKEFNSRIRCEHCGNMTTEESPMERWIRNHPLLDSRNGIVRFDIDILLHRYKTLIDGKWDREVQFMMFIEVKTFNATLDDAQKDTLSVLNQVLRNRKPNMYSAPKQQVKGQPCKVYSHVKRKEVALRLLGGHVLYLSGSNPEDSETIHWDSRQIDNETLVDLLLFNRDPDNLDASKDDWMRRRSGPFEKIKDQYAWRDLFQQRLILDHMEKTQGN